jgi:hypothetical protein
MQLKGLRAILIGRVSIRNARRNDEVEGVNDVKEVEEETVLSFCARREAHPDAVALQAGVSPNPNS